MLLYYAEFFSLPIFIIKFRGIIFTRLLGQLTVFGLGQVKNLKDRTFSAQEFSMSIVQMIEYMPLGTLCIYLICLSDSHKHPKQEAPGALS